MWTREQLHAAETLQIFTHTSKTPYACKCAQICKAFRCSPRYVSTPAIGGKPVTLAGSFRGGSSYAHHITNLGIPGAYSVIQAQSTSRNGAQSFLFVDGRQAVVSCEAGEGCCQRRNTVFSITSNVTPSACQLRSRQTCKRCNVRATQSTL